MNVTQNQSPAFTAIYKSGKMNSNQVYNANLVSRHVSSLFDYTFLHNRKIDVCFLKPTREREGLRVCYFDNNNGTFVRDMNGKFLETVVKAKGELGYKQLQRSLDKIKQNMSGIMHGQFKAPDWSKDPGKYANEEKTVFERHQLA